MEHQTNNADESLSSEDRQQIRNLLVKHFSLAEIDLLCIDLDIDSDEIEGKTLSVKANALCSYCDRRGWFAKLYQAMKKARPGLIADDIDEQELADGSTDVQDANPLTGLFPRADRKCLEVLGMLKNPFEHYEINPRGMNEDDCISFFNGLFVNPLPASQLTTLNEAREAFLVYGREGLGKSAVRIALVAHCHELGFLAVEYDNEQFAKAMQQGYATSSIQHIRIFIREALDVIRRSHPQVDSTTKDWDTLNAFIDLRDGKSYALLDQKEFFRALVRIAKSVHLTRIVGIIDWADINVVYGDGTTNDLFFPFSEEYFRGVTDLSFRYIASTDCQHLRQLRKISKYELKWDVALAQKLIRQRIHAAKLQGQFTSLGERCEVTDIDTRIAVWADLNPRAVIWISRCLLESHCLFSRDKRIISKAACDHAKQQWIRKGRPDLFGPRPPAFKKYDSRIWYDTEEILIKGSERKQVLDMLVDAQGQSLTAEEIHDRLQNSDHGPNAQTFDQLKSKKDQNDAKKRISELIRNLRSELSDYELQGKKLDGYQLIVGKGAWKIAVPEDSNSSQTQ